MKKFSKIFVLAVVFALICAGLVVAASADSTTFDLKSALDAAKAGDTVTLTGDATLTSTYNVTKNVTIDLNGYKLTSEVATAFSVNQSVDFAIVGQGTIALEGMLINSSTGSLAPNVTVKGTYAPIKITHTGSKSDSVVYAINGTYTFNNVEVTSECNTANEAVFKTSNASSTATYNFIAVKINVTGAVAGTEAAIRIAGTAHINMVSSSVVTDGVGISLGGCVSTDDTVVIKDSYICSSNNELQVAPFGMYSSPTGVIRIENSLIESSYRVFCLSCESQTPVAVTDEEGTISLTSGGRVLCYDTVILHNCIKTNLISRAVPTFLYGSSKILLTKPLENIPSLVNFDTDSSSYTNNNKYVNIYMAEGTRVGNEYVTKKTAQGIKFPDGSSPETSTTYKFIYDPVTDPVAPWVVAPIDANNAYADADLFWFANGNGLANGSVEYATDTLVSGTVPSDKDIFPLVKVRWNKTGIYSLTESNGNKLFRYVSTVKENKSPSLTFGNRAPVDTMAYKDGVMVYELDIATDSAIGFASGTYKLDSRTSGNYNTTGSGSNGASGISLSTAGVLTFKNGQTELNNVTLSKNTWNRISLVVDGTTRNVTCFVNGTYVATLTSLYGDNAYIWGMRFDISKNLDPGRSLLVDNAMIACYSAPKMKTVNGESVKYDAADYLSEAPLSDEVTQSDITVGSKAYTDIDSAIKAAKDIGTVAQINANLTNVTVTENGTVSANGYTVTLTDSSLPNIVVNGSDGKPLYYSFSKNYDGELTFHWSVGNILTGEYTDITTTVRIGATPTYEYNASQIVYNATEKKIYKQTGWIGADTSNPLSPEYVEQMMNGESAGHVYVTPKIEAFDIAQAVIDSNGNLVSASEATELTTSSPLHKLAANQTYVLHKDCSLNTSGREFKNGTFGIDLNGHTLTIGTYTTVLKVGANGTLNVYSSAPGGAVYKWGIADGNNVRGNALFHIAPITDADAKIEANVTGSNHNSVLNIGKIDGITAAGSNLTLSGDCVVEPRTGDESCAVNIDGATFVRTGHNYASLIYPRFYNGSITVKNATLINTQKDYILSTPASYLEAVEFEYSTTALIDGCTLIQTSETMGAIGSTVGFDSITVKNTVVSGLLYEENTSVEAAKIKILENVAASAKPASSGESVWAKYNVPFSSDELTAIFGSVGYYKTVKLTASSGVLNEKALYVIVKGTDKSSIPSGAVVRELEPLAYMSITGRECVDVTWKDLNGDTMKTEKYVVGGNVVDEGLIPEDCTDGFVALKKSFVSWGTLPSELTADTVIEPAYELADTITGLKYNLSLYADFSINLYIPAEYKSFVKVYSDASMENELTLTEVSINGISYVKAVISQLCNEASENKTFYVAISETLNGTVYTTERTITASAAGYAKNVISAPDDFTSEDRVLVYYMLQYANEAAKYFNGVENDSFISALLAEYEDVGKMLISTKPYAPIDEGLDTVFDTVAVRAEESPAFIFRLHEGFCGSVTVTYADGQNVRVFNNFATTVTTAANRTLTIDGMKVYNFGTTLRISAEGTMGGSAVSVSGSFNLDSYVKYAEENSLSHFALVEALRTYSEVAGLYKGGTLGDNMLDYGRLKITAPEVIYTNYSGKELDITFTVPEYAEDITYEISDSRVKIENGRISASGAFSNAVTVKVKATTSKHEAEFSVTVTTFSPNRIEPNAQKYEAEGGTLSTAKQNGTVFVGDSYFTVGYWKDFYTDFADEDAYLLGVAGSNVDEWLVCSERLFYSLNPSEIIVHLGFNDIYNEAAYMTAPEIAEKLIRLLSSYHEAFPDAKVYFCSIESSKWSNNYTKSFTTAPEVNAAVSAFADECDWLGYVNTRYIFCDDEQKVVYTDGDGNADDNDDTGIYGQGSHPSVVAYDEYKKAIDAVRGKSADE